MTGAPAIADTEERNNAMTETAEVTMTSVSVPAGELRSRLKAVMPHAGTDVTLPALTCIRFEVRDGSLYLAATDRYTLAVARLRIPGADKAPIPDRGALLRPEAAKALRRMLKSACSKGTHGTAAIVIEDGKITVDAGQGQSCAWETPSWNFPEWRSMLHKMLGHEKAELGDGHGIGLAKLSRFTVGPRRENWPAFDPLHIRVTRPPAGSDGKASPVLLLRRGDWFLGCLMPVRLPSEPTSDLWAEWASVTAPAREG